MSAVEKYPGFPSLLYPGPTASLILADSSSSEITFVRSIPLSTPKNFEKCLNSSELDVAQP